MKCPLCMLYGLDVELEELEHDGRKYYRCKAPKWMRDHHRHQRTKKHAWNLIETAEEI
jgi:hypothetical protein